MLPYAHEYIEGMGIEKSKVIWISNGVEMDYYSSIKKYQGGSTNNLTLMYIGGHAPHLGLDVIIDAASILQKGNKHKNTIPILFAPNKIGGTEALIPSFAVGYALPNKNITNKINKV